MYIGDSEVLSKEGEFDHRSPIDTSIIVGRFQKGTRENLKEAIEEANKSFENWRSLPWEERVKILGRAAELIDERKFEIAAAITYEVGKTRLEALAEAWEAIDAIKYFSRVMHENKGYVKKMGPGGPGRTAPWYANHTGLGSSFPPSIFPSCLQTVWLQAP